VEGVRDRAFWAGGLLQNGWQDARELSGNKKALDPNDRKQDGEGKFAYYARNDAFTLVVPCLGESKLDDKFNFYGKEVFLSIREHANTTKYRLIVNVDADTDETKGATNPTRNSDAIRHLVETAMTHIELETSSKPPPPRFENGAWLLFDDRCVVQVVRWQTPDSGEIAGVPNKQTLERLVCAAICEAYDTRSEDVEAWLREKSRSPKAYAWSYMAGWYAEHGCDDFYREIWRDETVRPILERQLKAIGAWAIFDTLSHPSA